MSRWNILSPICRIAKELYSRFFPKNPPPIEDLRLHPDWKERLEEKLRGRTLGDAIIRDVDRIDAYPNKAKKRKGVPPWFRVGLLGPYRDGLEIGLKKVGLKYEKESNGWRYCDTKKGETRTIDAYLVGRIPFERIVSIDWEGDGHYPMPHIYCHFSSQKKEPYDELVFCVEKKQHDSVYYSEVAKLDEVERLSNKLNKGA